MSREYKSGRKEQGAVGCSREQRAGNNEQGKGNIKQGEGSSKQEIESRKKGARIMD